MNDPSKAIANAESWRSASRRSRERRAEELTLPSGATILAARPEPLEWILAGRVPQRLLAAALGESQGHPREINPDHPRDTNSGHPRASDPGHPRASGDQDSRFRGNDSLDAGTGMTREEVLELARFAAQLVQASVVTPAIGEGPGEISLDEIPIEDRAFIFEWACRALGSGPDEAHSARGTGISPVPRHDRDGRATSGAKEDHASPSSDGLERFCAQ